MMPTIALLVGAFVLLFAIPATGADGVSPALPRLYMTAEGTQSAIPERYLRELCELIKADDATRSKFRSVSVYRYAPDLSTIAGKVIENVVTNGSANADALAALSGLMHKQEHRCFGRDEDVPTPQDTYVLLRLEWIGGPMSGEMRAQRAFIDRSTSDVKEAEYVRVLDSSRNTARSIGVRFLPIDSFLNVRLRVGVPPKARCLDQGASNCVMLGESVDVELDVGENVWSSARDVTHTWEGSCSGSDSPASPKVGEREGIAWADRRARSTSGQVLSTGSCTVAANVKAFGKEMRVASREQFLVKAGSMLVRSNEDYGVAAVRTIEAKLREPRYFPFIPASTNADSAWKEAFGGLYTVSPAAILEFGRAVRARLKKLGASAALSEYATESTRVLGRVLDEQGDLLGYNILSTNPRLEVTRYSAFGPSLSLVEPFCLNLYKRMAEMWRREKIDSPALDDWSMKCSEIALQERSKLAYQVKAVEQVRLRRVEGERVYRFIPMLQEKPAATFALDSGGFARTLDSARKQIEAYDVHGVDIAGVQTRPVRLSVRARAPVPSAGFFGYLTAGTDISEAGFGGGFTMGVYALFLEELVQLSMSCSLLYGRKFFGRPSDANLNDLLRLRGDLAFNGLCTFNGSHRFDESCLWMFAPLVGYEMLSGEPYIGVRLGYQFERKWIRRSGPSLMVEYSFRDAAVFYGGVTSSF
ncbi:hypothetical protein WME89_31675 [Sorangium sp. So ce321]|uniref:hypothetical protein n=1 Tax=Sorangium sp. So ce321 TaxID=3133300 RepID=UPI003F5FA15E